MSMERRYEARLEGLLGDAEVQPMVLCNMLPRLEEFLQPFAHHLCRSETRENAHDYVAGLLSNLESKNVESIAYLHDEDRQSLQKFIGQAPWDHRPLQSELARQVGAELGAADAVLVFDPSAFPKSGTESVGVQRQWCGRLGKVDNCQVGIFLGYVSRVEHALVDMRLYLPKEWASDKKRRAKAGVPRAISFQTRHAQCLEMLDANGPLLPHSWIAGDDEMGRSTQFRQDLRARQERYLLAVPSNTLVRDVNAPPTNRDRPAPFLRVDRWAAGLPASAWTTIEVRAGERGPVVVQAVVMRVLAKTEQRRSGTEETLVVFRERQADRTWKHDYLLSNAAVETPVAEFARVFKAEHRIEECLQRAKSEAGLADYEVRTWQGWHHHLILSLIATWFLTQEARRGKKMDTGDYRAAGSLGDCHAVAGGAAWSWARVHSPDHATTYRTQGTSILLPLEKT
jgi:SRSO17 transposase